MVNAIVAMGENRLIGRKNGLVWHIPDDLKRFKTLTLGHPVIMGRKTFESILTILGKPLPGRTNIVVTRSPDATSRRNLDNVLVTQSLKEALEKAGEIDQEEIFIIGGAQIYEQALPFVDRLYLTLIDDRKDGDAYFPAYEHLFTKKLSEEFREHEGLKYSWVTLGK
ncbi:MAG: dihydrofolate reductase [Patescibacteria group bacterium]